jgi:predicted phosphodiesterase
MRIHVITDVHGNLPALQAALSAMGREGGDAIYHTGDAVGIGPFPAECLDMLLSTPRLHNVMGNHDAWLAHGLPEPTPPWMGEGETRHQRWTHAQITPELREAVAAWPYTLRQEFEGVPALFTHYGLAENGTNFRAIVRDPSGADLDSLFEDPDAALAFYGHHHPHSDLQGRRTRYVNPGSLGCHTEPVARYAVAEFARGRFTVEHRAVGYDDAPLRRAFAERGVPERDIILKAFFGDRFRVRV